MAPARAGMIRSVARAMTICICGPRESGDDPNRKRSNLLPEWWPPRERG